jgi:hypothetical protein
MRCGRLNQHIIFEKIMGRIFDEEFDRRGEAAAQRMQVRVAKQNYASRKLIAGLAAAATALTILSVMYQEYQAARPAANSVQTSLSRAGRTLTPSSR